MNVKQSNMEARIKHVDGITDVIAKASVCKEGINLEYRLDGMTYGLTISLPNSIEIGLVKKVMANNSFREIVKGEIYDISTIYYTEDNVACPKGTMIINGFHHSNFNAVI